MPTLRANPPCHSLGPPGKSSRVPAASRVSATNAWREEEGTRHSEKRICLFSVGFSCGYMVELCASKSRKGFSCLFSGQNDFGPKHDRGFCLPSVMVLRLSRETLSSKEAVLRLVVERCKQQFFKRADGDCDDVPKLLTVIRSR